MSDPNPATVWLDALAGIVSPTGRDSEYLVNAAVQWARSQWQGECHADSNTANDLAQRLRVLTGHDERHLATCLAASSREELLQWAWVLCRLHHQSKRKSAASSDAQNSGSRCLTAVGSDHGNGIVGRMASGRADSRSSPWPLVPGFIHAPLDLLVERIDDSTAMVLIAPVDVHDRALAVSREQLVAIRDACNHHGACLVIDHSQIPPHGGGRFWVHEAIATVTADAVIMSAGLTGGNDGGLLSLSESLAQHVASLSMSSAPVTGRSAISALAAATLDQWIEHSWVDAQLDEFPTELAGRLANHECVRDLHVTGRTIAMELDVPAAQWLKIAVDHQLGAASAGEFAVVLQPPLILRPDDAAELFDRIDQVFGRIEMQERKATSATMQKEPRALEGPALDPSQQEIASDSGYDVSETEPLQDDLDDQLYRDDENHAPALPADPEIQS